MMDLFTGAIRIVRRVAPATIAAAAGAFTLGAYSGHAATLFGPKSIHPTFTLTLRQRSVALEPGSSARLGVVVHRRRLRSAVGLGVASQLPQGVSARFFPQRTRGGHATLVLGVSSSASPGRYLLLLRGRAAHVDRSVGLELRVLSPEAPTPPSTEAHPDFSITGSVAVPLEPGSPQPIDVLITNPNDLPLNLMSLTVGVHSIRAPRASAALPCTAADFTVGPYTGQALTIPASSSRSLSALGVPGSQWPEVGVINRPTNQDGCQGASLSLTYSSEARLG